MLGKIIDDFACRSTNKKCGTNMKFVTIMETISPKNLFNYGKCIQRCSCISNEYEEKNGNCVQKFRFSDHQVFLK